MVTGVLVAVTVPAGIAFAVVGPGPTSNPPSTRAYDQQRGTAVYRFVALGVPIGVTLSFLIASPRVNEIAIGPYPPSDSCVSFSHQALQHRPAHRISRRGEQPHRSARAPTVSRIAGRLVMRRV